jgi:hypothetical protein
MGFCAKEIPSCSPFNPMLPLQPRIEIVQFLAVCGCAEADGLTGLNPNNHEKGFKFKEKTIRFKEEERA